MPARGHGAKWPRLLKRAARILAKVLARGGTYRDAARQAGISRATIFLWVKELPFQGSYWREHQRQLKRAIHATMQANFRPSSSGSPAA
jgi:transposase-like protein